MAMAARQPVRWAARPKAAVPMAVAEMPAVTVRPEAAQATAAVMAPRERAGQARAVLPGPQATVPAASRAATAT